MKETTKTKLFNISLIICIFLALYIFICVLGMTKYYEINEYNCEQIREGILGKINLARTEVFIIPFHYSPINYHTKADLFYYYYTNCLNKNIGNI